MRFQGLPKEDLFGKISVEFIGEEAVDAGGPAREWFFKVSQQMMNAGYGLFRQSNIGSETFQPNPQSGINPQHLMYFIFCGRFVAKAIYDNQLLECHFTRAFYKQILGKPVSWRDMEAVDEEHFKNLNWMLENDISDMEVWVLLECVFYITNLFRVIGPLPSMLIDSESSKRSISR